AFRARREELEQLNQKQKGGWPSQEEFEKTGREHIARKTAEHHTFDIQAIDRAIGEAKRASLGRNKEGEIFNEENRASIFDRLEAAKALIEIEIGIETPTPELVPPQPESAPQAPPEQSPKAEKKEEEVKKEASPEEDRDALKKKLFPEQRQEAQPQPEPKPAEQPPAAAAAVAEGERPPASGELPASPERERGEPEARAVINELLGGEMAGNERVREAARGVIAAREQLLGNYPRSLLARLKARFSGISVEEGVYEEAMRNVLNVTAQEKASAMRAEGRSEEEIKKEILFTKFNLNTAEIQRMFHLRERAAPAEWVGVLPKLFQHLNTPFEKVLEKAHLDKRYAKHLRIVTGAAVMTGMGVFGGAGLVGAGIFFAARTSLPYALMGANMVIRGGAEAYLSRNTTRGMEQLMKGSHTELERGLHLKETVEESNKRFEQEREKFQNQYEKLLRKQRLSGAAITAGLTLASIIAARYGYAGVKNAIGPEAPLGGSGRGGVAPPETSPIKPHMAIIEESLRERIGKAWERFAQGAKELGEKAKEGAGDIWEDTKKYWGEKGKHIYERAEELGRAGIPHAEAVARAAEEAAADVAARARAAGIPFWWDAEEEMPPKSTLVEPKLGPSIYPDETVESRPREVLRSPEEESAALRSARGGLPPHESIEEVQKRMDGIMEEGEKAFRTPEEEAAALRSSKDGLPPHESAEDVARRITAAKEAVEHADKIVEKLGVIPKGGSIWETAMDMKRHGVMTPEQFNEAWEKSTAMINGKEVPLRDVWLTHKEDALKFVETPEGPRLQLIDAKDAFKAGTYKELGDAYDALGKEQPASLKAALAHEQHLPSAAEQLKNVVDTETARPAIDSSVIKAMENAPVADGKSLSAALENPQNYIKGFEKGSLLDQEAEIEGWKKTLEGIHAHAPMEDPHVVGIVAKAEGLVKQLENNETYLAHMKAWETFGNKWRNPMQLGIGKELWEQMMGWHIAKFSHVAKELETSYSLESPADDLERALGAHRSAVLALRDYMIKHGGGKLELRHNIPLGRFLKNILP
ncbi:MAG: hypothetical protein AAB846_01940, partial [Patescibacteria group bacterium]